MVMTDPAILSISMVVSLLFFCILFNFYLFFILLESLSPLNFYYL